MKDPLPESWNLAEIAATALFHGETVVDSDVLCWQIREDGRPLLVDSCILWLIVEKESERKWRLSHLYRHPRKEDKWDYAMGMDPSVTCKRDFDHPPSSEEVLDFIDSVMWDWELQEENGGFAIDSVVRELELQEQSGALVTDPQEEKDHSFEGFRYIDGRVCLRNWCRRTGTDFKCAVQKEYVRQSGLSEK